MTDQTTPQPGEKLEVEGEPCEWRAYAYLGQRIEDGKLRHRFHEVNFEDGQPQVELDSWLTFKCPGLRPHAGNIYLFVIQSKPDGKFSYFSKGMYGPGFWQQWPDKDARRQWQAEDIAARDAHKALKNQEREERFAEWEQALKPIARAWAKGGNYERRAIEIMVLDAIREGYGLGR